MLGSQAHGDRDGLLRLLSILALLCQEPNHVTRPDLTRTKQRALHQCWWHVIPTCIISALEVCDSGDYEHSLSRGHTGDHC